MRGCDVAERSVASAVATQMVAGRLCLGWLPAISPATLPRLIYTAYTMFNAATYSNRDTVMHRVDARVKVVLLIAYSVTLFCIHSWTGMAACAVLFAVCAALSKLPVLQCAKQLFPIWIILAFTLAANAFSFNVEHVASPVGLGAVSAGAFENWEPVVLVGTFGISPQGFARGCYYVLRIALLAFASLVLTTTTSSTDLSRALERSLSPLSRLGVPVRDLATIVSIALRFIPVTFDEFMMIRAAQQSRGAAFEVGRLRERIGAWIAVFIPLFVSLFRRADSLAVAMDVRCYGMGEATSINEASFGGFSYLQICLGLGVCFFVSLAW